VVEQGTHKPLVGSPNLPLGTRKPARAGFFITMQIQIDKLIRSKRRTLALIVERDGMLTVRAPMRSSLAMIESFIQKKADWITRTREKLKSIVPASARQYHNGETFLFLGSSFDLKLVKSQRPALQFDKGFTLDWNMQQKGAEYFTKWYKARAYEIISERVQEYAQRHNFIPKRVRIGSARTRWGSCSPDGTLNFTWRLVMAPLDVIDYVVVHELAHLRVKNHSSKFWKLVESICPEYKRQRKWLRECGEKLTL
jgi:predicted metal-dependent hydrolase